MITLNEKHKYEVNGKSYPGVSEIIEHFGFSDFSMVPDHILQPAINFGNVVHEVVRLGELGDINNFNSDHSIIWQHWLDFKESIDLKNCIVDLKSFKTPKLSNKLQIFGYKVLVETSKNSGLGMEEKLFSDLWKFCGKPDFYYGNKIRKLYILTIPDLKGFDYNKNVFEYDQKIDVKYENYFKFMLSIYNLKKSEGLI
jgi:hypothetical protein